jgi:hypothetical protein
MDPPNHRLNYIKKMNQLSEVRRQKLFLMALRQILLQQQQQQQQQQQ